MAVQWFLTDSPGGSGNWILSNGNLTARSPNTGNGAATTGNAPGINWVYGNTAFPTGQKTYIEYQVSGAATYTAFELGFGTLNTSPNFSIDYVNNPSAVINPVTSGLASYNLGIAIGNNNGQFVLYNPQGNAAGNATPNNWNNGDVIGLAIDRQSNPQTATWYLRNQLQATLNINGVGSSAIYPMAISWNGAGPTATINGGASSTKYTPPAGFSALDKSGVTPPTGGPTAVTIVTSPAGTVSAGIAYQAIATVTAGGAWHAAGDLQVSADQTGAGPSFSATPVAVLSAGNTVATFSNLLSGLLQPHQIYVQDSYYGNVWGPYNYNVATSSGGGTSPTTRTVAVNDPSIVFSPCLWYGSANNRPDAVSASTWDMGASMTQVWTASAAPTYVVNGSFSPGGASPFKVDYILNGVTTLGVVSASGSLTITGINPGAKNTLQLFYGDNSNGVFTEWTISSITMDIGSVPNTAPNAGAYFLWYGDSITEGNQCEALQSYAYLVTKSQAGFSYANQSAAGSDLTIAGEAGYSAGLFPTSGTARWKTIASPTGTPITMLDSNGDISAYGQTGTGPSFIGICVGTNSEFNYNANGSPTPANYQTYYTNFLTALRAAASCPIAVIIPFQMYYATNYPNGAAFITAIKNAVTAANAAGLKINLFDLGSNVSLNLLSNNLLNADQVHPTPAGHVYLAGLISPLVTTILQSVVVTPPPPPPSTGILGLPKWGFGTPLAYANQGQTSIANAWAFMTQWFCVGRTMLAYVGWDTLSAVLADSPNLAAQWVADPTLNGTNTGKHCIPIIGHSMTTGDGATGGLTFANAADGSMDANFRTICQGWNGFPTISIRWGFEDMYPTTPSGVSAIPKYNDQVSSGPDNYTPWQFYGQNAAAYSAAYIPAWRRFAYIAHQYGQSINQEISVIWGPCTQNGTDFDTRNIYPDSILTDGHGKQVDWDGPDVYFNNIYGNAGSNTHPNYQNQARFTAYTGTPGTGSVDQNQATWNLDVGSRVYAMDWLVGTAPVANPTLHFNNLGGWGCYQSFIFALQNGDPIGIPEYGGAYGAGNQYSGEYGPPPGAIGSAQSMFSGPPGSVNAQDSQGNVNSQGQVIQPVPNSNAWTTDYPWGGAWCRQISTWLMTAGSVGTSGNGYNGVAAIQPQQFSFWQNQSVVTLLGHRAAFPELVANPDAGSSSGGGGIQYIILPAFAALGVGVQSTITFTLNYTPVLSNLQFNPDGSGFISLPGGATLGGSGSVSFPYTPPTAGNFTMTIKDTSIPISSFGTQYQVSIAQPTGISILVPPIPNQTAGQAYTVQYAFNGYRPIQTNILVSHTVNGVALQPLSAFAGNNPTWSDNGQLLSLTYTDGLQVVHYNQVQDTTFAPSLLSNEVNNNVGTSGGGGTVTVTTPIAAPGGSTTPTITLNAPGTVTESSPGSGVASVAITATTQNLTTTTISWKVVENNGAGPDRTSYVTAALNAQGIATFTASLHNNDVVVAVDNVGTSLVAHTWTAASGLNTGEWTFSNGNKTITVPAPTNPNVWTSVWANGSIPPGTKTYFECTVRGMVTGTASGVGVGSVADGFIAGTTTQLNNPAYQVSLGYNGSTAYDVNGVSTTLINPRQWPNNTPPPGWQLTPGTGLEAWTYQASNGDIIEGYATINTGYPQANGNTSAHVIWGGAAGLSTVVGMMVDQINMQFSEQWLDVSTGTKQTIGPFPITFNKTLTPVTGCQTGFLGAGAISNTINGGASAFAMTIPAGYSPYDGGSITAVTAQSSPATVVAVGNVTPTMSISAPGTLQQIAGNTGAQTNAQITTSNLTGTIYWGVVTAGLVLEGALTAVAIGSGGVTSITPTFLNSGDKIVAQNTLTSPTTGPVYSSPVTILPASGVPSLSINSPGTITLAPGVTGATVQFNVTATNLSGTVNWTVNASGGVLRSSGTTTLGVQGYATFSANLVANGDTVTVSSATSPTVSATTNPVLFVTSSPTSTVQTISISSPGTVTEASSGVGVTIPFTVTTNNVPGGIQYQVRRSTRAVETSLITLLPSGGATTVTSAITVPATIPNQTGGQSFSVEAAFNYVPNQANVQVSATTTAAGLSSGWVGLGTSANLLSAVWSNGGQLLTISLVNGLQVPHQFAVRDTSTTTPLQSAAITYNVGSSGGGGTVTVPAPILVGTGGTSGNGVFTFSQLMLHAGDYLQVTATPPPTVAAMSAVAWMTWTGTGPYTYTYNLLNNGNAPISSLWAFWIPSPDTDLLPTIPTPGTDPTGWAHSVQGGPPYSIQWTTTTTPLAPGAQMAFTFASADTPNTMFGFSAAYPTSLTTTSLVYQGALLVGTSAEFTAPDNSIAGTTAISSPVNIVEVGNSNPTISISAPGTVAAGPSGGATVPLQVTTTNLSGTISWEILEANGAVEVGYTAVAIPSGWTAVTTDTFTRANTTVNGTAGSTSGAGNGWIDQAGGVYNIASDTLLSTTSTHNIVDYLARPVGETAVNSRITGTFVFETSNMAEVAVGLRQQASNSQQSYLARCATSSGGGGNVLTIFSYNAAGTQLATGSAITLTNGASYTLDFQAVGTNPTNLTVTLFDSTGAQLGQLTVSDSTGVLQATGVPYLLVWAAPSSTEVATWTGAVTYTGSGAALTITPHFLNDQDRVQIVDNPASATITVQSSPVTITGTATVLTPFVSATIISLSAAQNGSGYNASLNIGAQNLSSSTVYVEVLDPNGNVEVPFYPVTLGLTFGGATYGGSANVTVPFASNGDSIIIQDQVTPAPNTIYTTGPLSVTSIPQNASATVTQPTTLFVGQQLISGVYSAGVLPAATYLYWITPAVGSGTIPTLLDSNAVQATIDATTSPPTFYAAINITGAGAAGTLYIDQSGNGVFSAAFTTTPISAGNVTATVDAQPTPFLPGGPQPITGTITDSSAVLLVALQSTTASPPVPSSPNVVTATIVNGVWTAEVVAGPAGIAQFVYLSIDGEAFYDAASMTPAAQIVISQPVQQYNTLPYSVIVDFNYILAIPSGGPIPASVQYSETGGAPFKAVTLAPGGTQVTRNAQNNTRLILGLNDPLPVSVELVVQDAGPPGGGATIFSNIVDYTVALKPTPTGSPLIQAYNPLVQQTNVPWTGEADFTYALSNLSTISVSYNGTGLVAASSLPLGAVLGHNPTVPGASRVTFTLKNTVAGSNVTFQVQDSAPPGGGAAIQSAPQFFAVLPYTPPAIAATEQYVTVWASGATDVQVRRLGDTIVSQGFVGNSTPTVATAINLFTPPQTSPNKTVVLSFTFTGAPLSFDYTLTGGSTWATALPGNTGINNSTLTGTITLPVGVPAAAVYAIGQVGVRDSNAHNIVSMSKGQWVVSTFNPASVSSFTPRFGAQIGNPALTKTNSSNQVVQLNDFFGSGAFLTVGPTAPANNPAGSTFSGVNPVSMLRLTGIDSGQAGLGMTPTTNSGAFDNNANYFGAGIIGGNGGVNDQLIAMWNQTDLTSNNGLVVYGVNFDSSLNYEGGPIWGWWPSATTGAYMTAGRWHSGQFNAQYNNTLSTYFEQTSPTLAPVSGYHVITTQQIGTLFQVRIDGGAWSTITLPAGATFAATTFSYGGSIIQNIGEINSGNSYPALFDFYTGTGTPSSGDISNFESWVYHSYGHS